MSKEKTSTKMPKAPAFPCIRCKKNVAKEKAIGCATCGLWVHKDCEEMPDEIFNILVKKLGGIKWHCPSCEASTERLAASIKLVETRLNGVEDRLGAAEEKSKLVEAKADNALLIAEQARAAAENASGDITKVVFEELSKREDKKSNIILHNVGESDSTDLAESKKWDEDSFNNITEAIGVNLKYQECATFSRRLGMGNRDRARPLLIGLKTEEQKAAILGCASKLATTHLRGVSVVPDLTKKQREMDEEVRREADRKNRDELTEDDRAKNLRWVAVGRKGARKIVKKVYTERQFQHSQQPNNNSRFNNQPNSTRLASGSNTTIVGPAKKRPATEQPTAATKKKSRQVEAEVGVEVDEEEEDEESEMDEQDTI